MLLITELTGDYLHSNIEEGVSIRKFESGQTETCTGRQRRWEGGREGESEGWREGEGGEGEREGGRHGKYVHVQKGLGIFLENRENPAATRD